MYRKAVGAVVIFDVCDLQTFKNVDFLINEVKQRAEPNAVIILVGNKVDLTTGY